MWPEGFLVILTLAGDGSAVVLGFSEVFLGDLCSSAVARSWYLCLGTSRVTRIVLMASKKVTLFSEGVTSFMS